MNKGPARPPKGVPGPGGRKIDFKVLGRVLKLVFQSYPVLFPITLVSIVFAAIVSSVPAVFQPVRRVF